MSEVDDDVDMVCPCCTEADIERAKVQAVMREIYQICHIPSGKQHAYTHFQQDFDRIRALTQPYI